MACYYTVPGQNFTTHTTPNSGLLALTLKSGASRAVSVRQAIGSGRDTARTTLNAIQYELIKWTSTATAVGTGAAVTPAPTDPGFQAAKATAQSASGQGGTALTTGTGGPIVHGTWTSSLTSSQPWVEYNQDALPTIEGGATMSIDIRISSPITQALCFASMGIVE